MTSFSPFLTIGSDHVLHFDGVSTIDLAQDYGTPLFVLSEGAIRHNFRKVKVAFANAYPADVLICVGMKANWGLAARRIIVQEGGGGDAFGLGELTVALLAGSDPETLVMNGPNKSKETLVAAITAGVTINVDNLDELAMVQNSASALGKKATVALRIRLPLETLVGRRYVDTRYRPPGVDLGAWEREFKFGMEPESFFAGVETALASDHVALRGVHYHGGIPRRAGYHMQEVAELMEFLGAVRDRYKWEPSLLNIGGGFVSPRYGEDPPPSIDKYASDIGSVITDSCAALRLTVPKLIIEPGRYCWESAGIWLTRVGNIKEDRTLARKKWVYVDGNINEVGDPFDPFAGSRHVVVANDCARESVEVIDICGQLCNAADILAKERKMPRLETGDTLALLDMGAYNEAFASQANAMPRSATVMVSEGRSFVVRWRESIQDVLAREAVPYWLLAGVAETRGD